MSDDDDDGLTDAQLEQLHALIVQRRDEVRDSIIESKDEARPVGLDLSIGRLTRVDALQQQQMALARRRRLEAQLGQIEHALSRLQAGIYGDCIRCGEPIGFKRLSVRPEAPSCMRCQSGSGG